MAKGVRAGLIVIDEIRNIRSAKKDLRNFGLSVGIVLVLIGGVLYWRERSVYSYFMGIGGLLVLCGLAAPAVLKPLQKAWMAFSVITGWFMTRLILSILFFLVFTPLGITWRLFGKRFLVLDREPSRESYWDYRSRKPKEKSSYEKQF